jgi:hypothetical protein
LQPAAAAAYADHVISLVLLSSVQFMLLQWWLSALVFGACSMKATFPGVAVHTVTHKMILPQVVLVI